MSQTTEFAGPNPLQITEIVANVMQHVNKDGNRDARTLFSCLQVNSLWFDEATTCLWSYRPSVWALFKTRKDLNRCQYYADKIVVLNYDGRECKPYILFSKLRFPRLEDLSIGCYDEAERNHLFPHMLQPRLKRLSLMKCCIHDKGLLQWNTWCPLLTTLSLTIQPATDMLLRCLESAPLITDLTLRFDNVPYYEEPFKMPDDLFVHLAERQHMQSLCMDNSLLTISATRAMLGRVTQPFQNLPVLRCLADDDAFDELVPHLPELVELHVSFLYSATDNVMESIGGIAHCTSLKTLEISFEDSEYYFSHQGLLLIAEQCTQLRSLTFRIQDAFLDGIGYLVFVEDRHIRELSARLPNLTTFNLDLFEGTELTVHSLRHLGEACPRLEMCSFPMVSQFEQLERSGPPILPQLKTLQLYVNVDAPPFKIITDALHYHTPMLEVFNYDGNSSYSKRVMNKLLERRVLRVDFESNGISEATSESGGRAGSPSRAVQRADA